MPKMAFGHKCYLAKSMSQQTNTCFDRFGIFASATIHLLIQYNYTFTLLNICSISLCE